MQPYIFGCFVLLSINFQEFSPTQSLFFLSSIKCYQYHSIFPFIFNILCCKKSLKMSKGSSIKGQTILCRLVFQQTTVILIGSNCAPLSADLFLLVYGIDLLPWILKYKFAQTFDSIFAI